MKKVLTLILAISLAVTALAACGSQTIGNSDGASASQEQMQEQELSDIVQAVKDAYGENYLPSMEITEDMMSDIYGVNMDNVDEFIAEAPAISAHVDTFIAVKAKEGKGEEVEKELQAYLDYVVDNSINYPMNVAKVQSAKVVRYDDYVFYVMLGGYNDENPDATEEENVKFAQDQTQLGLDTIASFFEK